MTSGVYAIRSPSGRIYVGSTSNMRKRWSAHRVALRHGTHHCIALQRSANKYGLDNLLFEIIEVCAIDQLLAREQLHIDARNDNYNSARTAGSLRGFKLSDDTKRKMSLAEQGKVRSPETRAKMSKYAKNRDPEHLAKLAVASTGRTASAKTRSKQRAAKLGSKQSAQHRANKSAGQISKPNRSNVSKVRGVSREGNKWRVRISVNGNYKNLGRYTTLEEAAVCVAAWRVESLATRNGG